MATLPAAELVEEKEEEEEVEKNDDNIPIAHILTRLRNEKSG